MSSPAPLRIFSPVQWHTLYSNEDYAKKERVLPYLLHFLIGKDQPETTVIDSINRVKKEKLVAHDPKNHNLTPLIIAAMKGNERIVEELLKQDLVKQNIDAADEYGWTALHHAALTSDTIFQKLIAAGAKPNPLTKLKGTPGDLRALTTPGSQGESIRNIFFEGQPLTPEIAQERFGFTYRDTSFFPPECLKELWQSKTMNSELINNYPIPPYRAPKLEIVPIDAEKGFYGLVAGEDIAAGTNLGDYPGLWANPQEDCSSFPYAFPREQSGKEAYLFGDFDAKPIGNGTRFANNGFPNMTPIGSVNGGVNKRTFIAAEAIKKGETILFNYGAKSYNVTYGPELLFNRDKIHAFFKPGLDTIVRKEKGKDYLNNMFLASRVLFPADNPLCLIDLHFSKVLDVKEWLKRLLETEQTLGGGLLTIWEEMHGCFIATPLKELVLRLSKIDQNIQKNAPSHYPLFQNWVLDRCQKLPLIDLMKAMDWIEEALVIKKDPTLLDGIETRLKSHDWSQDEEHLYSYTSRKKGFERQIDFGLLRHPQINDSNFFSSKEFSLRETLKNCAQYPNFTGSELERMVSETLNSLPQTTAAQAEYLAKAKTELKETQNLAK